MEIDNISLLYYVSTVEDVRDVMDSFATFLIGNYLPST